MATESDSMDKEDPGRSYKGKEYPTGSSPVSRGGTYLSPSPPVDDSKEAMDHPEHERITVKPASGGWDVIGDHGEILLHGMPDERRAIHEAEEIARHFHAELEVVGLDGSTKEVRHYTEERATTLDSP